jgi:cytochrome c oxidase subunit IV
MKTTSRIWFLLAGFLVVAGAVYGLTSHENTGAAMLVVAAAVFCYLGVVGRGLARGEGPDETAPEAEEVHVGPTIWPLVFSFSGVFVALGLIVTPWLLIVAVGLFGLAAAGWLREATQRHRKVEGSSSEA